jgi:hypothetical protein
MNEMDDDVKEFDIEELIPQDERDHMLFGLHRYLTWVGEVVPEEITVDGREIKLRNLIWKLTRKRKLTDNEKNCVRGLINLLDQKEKFDEERLEKAKLTREQAEQLYDEAAGLVRAIMDLRDLEEGKVMKADFDEIALRDKLEDARRWVKYVKQMKD